MKVSGFLPSSLFERLICKAVSWSQQTSKKLDGIVISEVFKDAAVLRYGRQRFQLTNLKEYNCIKVDVEGEYPVAIFRRLQSQIEMIIKESMKSLYFIPTLLYSPGSSSLSTASSSSKVDGNSAFNWFYQNYFLFCIWRRKRRLLTS